MAMGLQINGLWVPLITPFFQGQLDEESLVKLVKAIEPHIDGFVPCLSSGEGGKMTDALWESVVKIVIENTDKPVAVGILNPSMEKILELSEKAKILGCVAVVVPLQGDDIQSKKSFCKELSNKSYLPIILYNTEKVHIDSVEDLVDLTKGSSIISLKDSSQNKSFFKAMVQIKKEGRTRLSVLQGMENQLLESVGCDGFLLALANVEPELCKNMLSNPSKELNDEVMRQWDELDLASDTWYVGVKQALFSRNIIKSLELIH